MGLFVLIAWSTDAFAIASSRLYRTGLPIHYGAFYRFRWLRCWALGSAGIAQRFVG